MVELNYCDKRWVIECCVLPEHTICNPLRNHSATWPICLRCSRSTYSLDFIPSEIILSMMSMLKKTSDSSSGVAQEATTSLLQKA